MQSVIQQAATTRTTRALIYGLSLSALLFAASARPAQASVISETEPSNISGSNDSFATAQNVDAFFSDQSSNPNIFRNATNSATDPVFPSVSINGNISAGQDVDFYSFTGTAGAKTFFDIDTDGGLNPLSDSILSLFDPTGTLVALSDDDNGDPGSVDGTTSDSFIGVYTLPTNGLYRVAVSSNPNFPTSNGTASFLTALARPDGGSGGVAQNGSTAGVSSFIGDSTGGTGVYTLHISQSAAVVVPAPEPGTMTLMGIGLASLAATRRKKKKGEAADEDASETDFA